MQISRSILEVNHCCKLHLLLLITAIVPKRWIYIQYLNLGNINIKIAPLRISCSVNTRLLRNGSVLLWISYISVHLIWIRNQYVSMYMYND